MKIIREGSACFLLALPMALLLLACSEHGMQETSDQLAGLSPDGEEEGYRVAGHVSGLSGGTLELTLNGDEAIVIEENGRFRFETRLSQGGDYQVLIAEQPQDQLCELRHRQGRIDEESIQSVAVRCFQLNGSP